MSISNYPFVQKLLKQIIAQLFDCSRGGGGGGGGGGTRLIWWTGVCRWNGWLFRKKSLNMGYGFAKKIPKHGV